MNHLDCNYIQNYYPPGLLAVNAVTPNPADQVKYICSVWNAHASVWVDVHYQINPKALFVLISGESADKMTTIPMDKINIAMQPDFRLRVVLEFKKLTGKEIEMHTQHPKILASDVDKQHLTNMTLKKLQETKMMIIDEFKMNEPELPAFQKAAIDYIKTFDPALIPSPLLKLVPNFQSSFPSPVPLKSNMSKITWNIKDYIPFDTFTIINNLSRDYAYN